MAKYVFYAQTADGYVSNASATYATARSMTGGTLASDNASGSLIVGQKNVSGTYTCYESFISFDTSAIPATEQVVSSTLVLTAATNHGYATNVFPYDWGTAVSTASGVSGTTLAGLTGSGVLGTDSTTMMNGTTAGSGTRFVLASDQQTAGVAPGTNVDQTTTFDSADTSGTVNDPTLTAYTSVMSTLTHVGNGLAQTSDGLWVSLRSDGAATPTITLSYSANASAWTAIDTVPTGTVGGTFNVSTLHGHQVLSMCLDGSDNIYIAGVQGGNGYLMVYAYQRTPGTNTWTRKSADTTPLSNAILDPGTALEATYIASANRILVGLMTPAQNTVAVVWAMASFSASSLLNNQTGSEMIHGYLQESGVATGSGACVFKNLASTSSSDTYPAFSRVTLPGSNVAVMYPVLGNYTMSSTNAAPAAAIGFQNGENKVRAVRSGSNTHELIQDDSLGSYTNVGCFNRVQLYATASTFQAASSVQDSATGNTTQTQPATSKVAQSLKWDAYYDSSANKVWVYYLDTTDSRKLHRTSFSIGSGLWVGDDVVVNDAVGASGSSNLAVRCVTTPTNLTSMLVEVANLSGGVHSVISVIDFINHAPYAPTLSTRTPFDATKNSSVAWTFSDPDAGDIQTAYQVEIDNATTGATAYNSGKVVSSASTLTLPGNTLSNDVSYEFRVTTWDSHNVAGPASGWQTFVTSSAPVITLTAPNQANAPTANNYYDVSWTYSQAGSSPQASYRLVATRAADNSVLYDSGVVSSTATTQRATGLLSETCNVSLTVTSANNISTVVTGSVLPSFNSPDAPTVVATPVSGGVRIDITNPTPTGVRPAPRYNQLWSSNTGNGHHGLPDGSPPYYTNNGWTLLLDNIPLNSTVYDYGVVAGAAAGGAGKSESYFVRAVS